MRALLASIRARATLHVMRWSSLTRRQAPVLAAIVGLFLAHYAVFCLITPFFIEDSGISFAYARNIAEGLGAVPFAGGERVEGYSNATWTFILALGQVFWVDPFFLAKALGGLFGAITIIVVWALGHEARGDDDRFPDWSPLLGAALLACSTQFTLWASSGLENALFNLLMAAGIYRLAREAQVGGAPWSAVCFFLLTATRPDGLGYAGVAIFARTLMTLRYRQWTAWLVWLLAFAAPYAAYNAVRYDYFGWWWPNTYYAKEKSATVKLLGWTSGGWKQFKEWSFSYGVAFATPAVVIALVPFTGTWDRLRRFGLLALLAVFAMFTLWDGRIPSQIATQLPTAINSGWTTHVVRNWSTATISYLIGGAVILGLLTLPRKGWEVRGLLWGSFATGMFFWVWSNGDWMKAFRWGSLVAVPIFTLIGLGIGQLSTLIPTFRTWPTQRLFACAALVALASPNTWKGYDFVLNPETTVNDVRRRVNYMQSIADRLDLRDITLMDVDMGAHMYFTRWHIVDMAGLVDVPMARHKYQKSFIDDYVYNETKPTFAHVHGSWARTTKIPQNPGWKTDYIEIPGYPSGKRGYHVGNHIRREIVVQTRYTGPADTQVDFDGGVTLAGYSLPSPEVSPGGKLFLRAWWIATPRKVGFRVIGFIKDNTGNLHTAELAPAHDWYRPEKWKADEYVIGHWYMPLPPKLPEGTYDLGLVVIDMADGQVLPWLGADLGNGRETRFLPGEWVLPGAVKLVGADAAVAAADAKLAETHKLAADDQCEAARERFMDARRHIMRNTGWRGNHQDAADAAVIDCFLTRAERLPNLYGKSAAIRAALRVDPAHKRALGAGEIVADALIVEGYAARDAGQAQEAYLALLAAMRADPTRSEVRREIELLRDKRLGIAGKEPEKTKPEKTKPKPNAAQKLKDGFEPKAGKADAEAEAGGDAEQEAGGDAEQEAVGGD